MISFLWIHLFYPKKRWILCATIMILLFILSLLIDPTNDMYEEVLFKSTYLEGYELTMMKLMTLMMPFVVVILVMDHDQFYLRPLYSYFGRTKVILSKMVVYFIVLIILYIGLMVYYYLLFYVFKSHLPIKINVYPFIHLFLDALILLNFVLYLIRDKYKVFSIVIGIFYMIYQFVQEDFFHLSISYLFPFKNDHFESYLLAIPYKLCYIILGLLLTHRKMDNEPLKSSS